jgi:F-type H+-transporting ATPase subunit a
MLKALAMLEVTCKFGDDSCPFPAPGAEIFFFPPMASFTGPAGSTWEFNKPVLFASIAALIVIIFFLTAFARPKLVPRGMQNIGEVVYLFFKNHFAKDIIGHGGEKYIPLLMSLFSFIWIMNLFSIIPGIQFPITSRFAFPLVLSLIVYFTFIGVGIKSQGAGAYFKGIAFPDVQPRAILILLTPLELLSTFIIRPATLAIRLFANMFAGHLLLVIFSVSTWYLLNLTNFVGAVSIIGYFGSAMAFLVTIVLTFFEMFIQLLQAYIFTLLTAMFIAEAQSAHH